MVTSTYNSAGSTVNGGVLHSAYPPAGDTFSTAQILALVHEEFDDVLTYKDVRSQLGGHSCSTLRTHAGYASSDNRKRHPILRIRG